MRLNPVFRVYGFGVQRLAAVWELGYHGAGFIREQAARRIRASRLGSILNSKP